MRSSVATMYVLGFVFHAALLRREDRWHSSARRRILAERRHRLPRVRSEGSDVDEAGNLRIVARLRDHDATVGVADEDGRPVLGRERPLRNGYVVRQDVVGFCTTVTR